MLKCNIELCNHSIVDGGWSSWTYGSCSKTCGGGTQRMTRHCNNPTPYCEGKDCYGKDVDQRSCNNQCCPGKIIHNLHKYIRPHTEIATY